MSDMLLEGLTVVEYTHSVAGPYCGMLLADMGARVIRVEPPEGDATRRIGPLLNGESLFYMTLNRNKEAIVLDLKTDDGKKIMMDLLKKADIFIENFQPGVLADLGFSYEAVKKEKPAIVYVSITGYGQKGPYRDFKYSELMAQAMGGLMASSGEPDGYPARMGGNYAESVAGTIAATGALGAYYQTLSGSEGQQVDVSLVDSLLEVGSTYHFTYFANGLVTPRPGRYDNISVPFGIYKCKDGYIAVAIVAYPHLFFGVATTLERLDLVEDPDFNTGRMRKAHQDQFNEIMHGWLADKTMDEAYAAFVANGVPCCLINTIEDIVNDPHIGGVREMFPEYTDPKAGKVRITGSPIKFPNEPSAAIKPAPALGADTDTVLKYLGLDDSRIKKLRADKVVL
ncbi:MAG: CoA transferase [Treponema sp.]|jgi:CoA:oxalate CoA-transferase|nr:CoA transferase [Treponema sp.]